MLVPLEQYVSNDSNQAIVLQGVQNHSDLLYAKDFLDFAELHQNFSFRAHYSKEMPQNPAAHEYSGYIQTSLEKINLSPKQDIVYLCGNPYMIDETVALLKSLEFEPSSIKREKYFSK